MFRPLVRPLRCTRSPQAFTLIELLIVVAIIAILAAIAVPNFLEAQTRSKASRAKADLRSIATAIESYHVDQNKYPTMYAAGFTHAYGFAGLKWWYIPDALSTPVAYLSSAAGMLCPFGGDIPQRANFPGEIWRRYSYENVADLAGYTGPQSSILVGATGKYGPTADPLNRIGPWRVLCIGPDNSWNPMIQYDPSNGTVSKGNIMRTQVDTEGRGSEQR